MRSLGLKIEEVVEMCVPASWEKRVQVHSSMTALPASSFPFPNGGCCPHPQYFKVPSSPERQQHKEVKYCIPIPMAS